MPDRDEPVQLLRRHGLRVTPQRRAIIDAVRIAGGHVTAGAIFERVRTELQTISLKTVYETLHSLVLMGEVQELDLGTGPMHFDTTVRPHHHMVCLYCNRIEDVDFDVDAITNDRRKGFSIVRTEVIAWGRCPECEDQIVYSP